MEKLTHCALCKHEGLEDLKKETTRTVAGYTFTANIDAQRCPSCSEVFYRLDKLGDFEDNIAQWLATNGISSGEAFQFMRKTLGLRATELAQLLDLSPETISRWEKGHREPETRATSLLASMVLDKMEGHCRTQERLRSLQQPPPDTGHVDLTSLSPAPR